MTVTNTLAYTSTVLITAVKSLITQAPDVKVIGLLTWSNIHRSSKLECSSQASPNILVYVCVKAGRLPLLLYPLNGRL
jgi:hypothetical protein